jgi:two-component sensor histidine kinase
MGERWQLESGADEMLYVGELLHRVWNQHTNAISFAHSVAANSFSQETKTAVLSVANHLNALGATHHALRPPATDQPANFANSLSQLCQAMRFGIASLIGHAAPPAR